MASALRYQPFKGLYLVLELLGTVLIRIPLWALFALPPSWRPRSAWSPRRTVMLKLTRHLFSVLEVAGPIVTRPDHRAITGGTGVNGVWVEPTPQLVTGQLKIWSHATGVSPATIPGYWIHRKTSSLPVASPPAPGEKVLYFLHGGGYVALSGHPSDLTTAIPKGIVRHAHSVQRAFSLEYRLSSSAPKPVENPFPTALLDAVAGYNYLVNVVGFSPNDIIVAGDSAGGNLALALTRYLVEYKDTTDITLPSPPGNLILLSPWSDLGTSHQRPGASMHTFQPSDIIQPNKSSYDYARDSFVGPLGWGAALRNPYLSPASLEPGLTINFKGFPRTFIVAGGAEVFYDQILTLRKRMVKDIGDLVTYHEAKDGVHDYILFAWHEPERTTTLQALAQWIDA